MSTDEKKEKGALSKPAKEMYNMLTVRPARTESADIAAWVSAVNSFRNGNREKYYNLCENLMSDGVLADAIDKLVENVTGADIVFQVDGKNVDVRDELIDTPEFEELLKEIALAKVYGRSVIECSFTPAFDVFSWPRKHCVIRNIDKAISQRKKLIIAKEGDTNGYDYTEDEFFFEVGADNDLGLIFRAAQYVIYKRGNFGDWAQYAEIFGMPFVMGKYNSTDPAARDLLFTALGEIGGKPVAAVPKETDIEVVWGSGSGSSDLYKTLKDACNEEILIAIQGETMTTVSGSSLSQSEVHQDTNSKKAEALKRFVQRMLNKHFLPMLAKRGYPVTGGKFVFPKDTERISVSDITELSDLIDIPADFIHNKYGIPMAAEGEKLAKKANTTPLPPEGGANPPAVDPPAVEPQKQVPGKKGMKLSDSPPSGGWGAFFEGLSNFFAVARTKGSRAMSALNLADRSTNSTENLAGTGIDIDGLIARAIKEVYGNKGEKEIVNKSLFESNYKPLEIAISRELNDVGDKDFVKQFRTNTAVFSAFKAHLHTQTITDLLIGDDGKMKPFYKFKKEALQVSRKWKESWLQTEYQMAVRQARLAANLKDWETKLDIYPNLEYIESTASEKDEKHLEYVGTVLPFGHPWWKKHMPPSRWGCQCSVRPTRKPVTAVPGGEYNESGFENSVLDTASFVDLKETAYYKNTEEELREAIENEAERLAKELRKEQRAETLKKVMKLKGKEVTNKETGAKIGFTVKGLKDAINNPFANYTAKLEYIKQIDKALKSAEYIGEGANIKTGSKPHVLKYHYYKALIDGQEAAIVVSQDKWGKQTFYSISEKRKTTE